MLPSCYFDTPIGRDLIRRQRKTNVLFRRDNKLMVRVGGTEFTIAENPGPHLGGQGATSGVGR